MKRSIAILVLLAAATLAGCTPAVWTKPGATEQDFAQDKAYCQMEGQKAEASSIGQNGFLAGYENAQTAKYCMQSKGWSTVRGNAPAAEQAPKMPQIVIIRAPGQTHEEEQKLIQQCAAATSTTDDAIACVKRNHMIVMPDIEFSEYVQKAIDAGLVKASALKDGRPVRDADMIAVDKLIWDAYGIKHQASL